MLNFHDQSRYIKFYVSFCASVLRQPKENPQEKIGLLKSNLIYREKIRVIAVNTFPFWSLEIFFTINFFYDLKFVNFYT